MKRSLSTRALPSLTMLFFFPYLIFPITAYASMLIFQSPGFLEPTELLLFLFFVLVGSYILSCILFFPLKTMWTTNSFWRPTNAKLFLSVAIGFFLFFALIVSIPLFQHLPYRFIATYIHFPNHEIETCPLGWEDFCGLRRLSSQDYLYFFLLSLSTSALSYLSSCLLSSLVRNIRGKKASKH